MPQSNRHATSALTGQTKKRSKEPLMIRDPATHQPVEVAAATTSSTPATTTSRVFATTTITETRPTETTTDSTAINDTNKTQIQTAFRRQFAKLLTGS
jgi:hypothetical protein